MTALLRAELVSRWRMIAGLSLGVLAFMVVMSSTFKALGQGMLGTAFAAHTPKAISALSGSPDANMLSPTGWLGFGFAHPMYLLLSLTAAIAIPAAAIAGDVEHGRSELLFVRPRARLRFLGVWVAVWAIVQLVVASGSIVGYLVGSRFDAAITSVGIGPVLEATLQGLPLFAFVAGIAFLASSRAHTRSAAAGVTIGVTAALYLVDFASSVVGGMDWLRWLTPFGYYTPVKTFTAGFAFGHAAALTAGAAALVAAAAFNLQRRDLR